MVLATAMPRSLWAWTPTAKCGVADNTSATVAAAVRGFHSPTVSARRSRSTPSDSQSWAASVRRRASVREASMTPTETKPKRSRAVGTSDFNVRTTQGHVLSSDESWIAEPGTARCTAASPQAAAASRSTATARHQAVNRQGSRSDATSRIAVRSASPVAGHPTSISSTPTAANASAIRSRSRSANTTPGACAPSRSVVSTSYTSRQPDVPFADKAAERKADFRRVKAFSRRGQVTISASAGCSFSSASRI